MKSKTLLFAEDVFLRTTPSPSGQSYRLLHIEGSIHPRKKVSTVFPITVAMRGVAMRIYDTIIVVGHKLQTQSRTLILNTLFYLGDNCSFYVHMPEPSPRDFSWHLPSVL